MFRFPRLAFLLLGSAAVLIHCAPAYPLWSGATTTPSERSAAGLGAAIAVPLGELRTDDVSGRDVRSLNASVTPGGAMPVLQYRLGLDRQTDLGLTVGGTLGSLGFRRRFVLDEARRWSVLVGGAVRGGWTWGPFDASAERVGGDIPVVIGYTLAGYELWMGARVSADGVWGRAETVQHQAVSFGAGLLAGAAVGLRWFHALVEMEGDYVAVWNGDTVRHGVVLTPSFGVRLRW